MLAELSSPHGSLFRGCLPPQASLSRELRTEELLPMHVSVGYRWQNTWLIVKTYINKYLCDITSHHNKKLNGLQGGAKRNLANPLKRRVMPFFMQPDLLCIPYEFCHTALISNTFYSVTSVNVKVAVPRVVTVSIAALRTE